MVKGGTIVEITGTAWARGDDGKLRKLVVGSTLQPDETVILDQGAQVRVAEGSGPGAPIVTLSSPDAGAPAIIPPGKAEAMVASPDIIRMVREDLGDGGRPAKHETGEERSGDGFRFIELTRISQQLESDGLAPLTLARVQEIIPPMGLEWDHVPLDMVDRHFGAPTGDDQFVRIEPITAAPDTHEIIEDSVATGNVVLNDDTPGGRPVSITQFVIGDQTYLAGSKATIADIGTFTLAGDGSYTFIPVADCHGPVPTITYTLSNGTRPGTSSSTLDIVITPVADIVSNTATVESGHSVTTPVLGNDSFENTGARVSAVTQGQHGTATLNADGTITYTPYPDYAGTDSYTYTVTSGGMTETTTVTVTITLTPPAPAPDTATTPEDTPVSGNVLTNDATPGDRPLHITSFTVGGQTYTAGATATIAGIGTLTLGADGSYAFTPVLDWNGTVPTVTYSATDGTSAGAITSTLDIVVTPVADIVPDLVTIIDGQPVKTPVLINDTFENSDAHISGVTQGQHGSTTINPDGTITYTPTPGYSGPDEYTYTVTSGGVTETVTVTLEVSAKTLLIRPDIATTPEDVPVSGNVLTNDVTNSDQALRVIEFTIGGKTYTAGATVRIAGIGTFTLDPDGSYTFTPIADWNGTVPTVTYTATDDTLGGTASSTLNIVVTPVVDIEPDVATVENGHSVTTQVLINDTFENSDAHISSVTQGQHGTVTVNPDGTITYTPTSGYSGPDQYTYTVTSGGVTETTTVTIDVTLQPPVPSADSASTPEDTPVSGNVLTNDDTPGDRPLQVTGFTVNGQTYPAGTTGTIAGAGTIIVNADGSYTFTPVPDWNGTVPTVTYNATDGTTAGTYTNTLDIVVTPVTDIAADVDSVHAGKAVTTRVLTNDTFENSDARITGATQGQHGTVTINSDGTITYTPQPGYVGPDQYTYTVTSGGVTETTTVTITVTNDPVIARPDVATTPEDTPVSGNVLTNDSDANNDPLTLVNFTVNGQTYTAGSTAVIAGVGTISISASGAYTFTPVADWNGTVPQISYVVTDSNNGGSATGTLTIVVTPVVDVVADTATVHAGDTVTTTVLGNDNFENTDAKVTGATNGAHGTVTVNANGTVTYTPDAGYVGTDSYTYTVTSGGVTETGTVTVTITNTPPEATNDTNTTDEDVPVSGNVLGNDSDPDDDAIHVTQFTVGGQTYTAGSTATITGVGTIRINTDGSYTFTPAKDWNGTTPSIGYTVSDGNTGGTDTGTLQIVVDPVNDAPVNDADLGDRSNKDADAITSVDISGGFKDIDGDTLTYSITGLPTGLVYDPATGVISGTINRSASQGGPDGDGKFTVEVTATDGQLESTQTFTWTITNPPPVARDDTGSTDEETFLSVSEANGVIKSGLASSGKDSDSDGDPLTVSAVGAVAANVGQPVSGSDGGTFRIYADGSYTFNPGSDFQSLAVGESRETSVTYTISDGEGGTDTATLTITVNGVNDAPVREGTLPNQTDADSDTITAVGVAGGFSDVDGDTLTYSATGLPSGLSIDKDTGEITGTINHSASTVSGGVYSVTVTASDGNGGSQTQTFTWTVTNPAPEAKPDTGSVTEDGPALTVTAANGVIRSTTVATGQDSDPDGDTLNVTRFTTQGGTLPALGNAGGSVTGTYGSLTLNADGSYTYTLNNGNPKINALKDDETLTDTFKYEISDGEGGTATTTLEITINGHTDAEPTIAAVDGNGTVTGDVTVYESGLTTNDPDGHSYSATGKISIAASDGLASITIGGTGGTTLTLAQLTALSASNTVTIETPLGQLVLTGYTSTGAIGGVSVAGSLSYTYNLQQAASSSPSGPDIVTETIPLSVKDAGGGTGSGNLVVAIVDDIPSFRTIDSVTLHESNLANGTDPVAMALTQTGSLDVRTGADLTGFDTRLVDTQTAPVGLKAGGVQIVYTVSADGHSLTATAGSGGATVFTVTLTNPTAANAGYSFKLFAPLDDNGADLKLNFPVKAIDGDGDTATTDDSGATAAINVTIVDDVPFGIDEARVSLAEGGVTVGTGNGSPNLLTNELAGNDDGADEGLKVTRIAYTNEAGSAATADVPDGGSVTVDTRYGSLTVSSNGAWTFTSDATENNAAGVADNFTYTIMDGDGSTDTAVQPLTITDTSPAAGTVELALLEANIPGTGSTAQTTNTTELNLGITKSADAISDVKFDAATITGLNAQNLKSGGTALTYTVSTDGHTLTAKAGSVTIFTLDLVNATDATGATQKVVMSLVGSLDHADATGSNTLVINNVAYKIYDTDSSTSATMKLTVTDDLPTAAADTTRVQVAEGGVTVSTGAGLLANDTPGADQSKVHVHQIRYTGEDGASHTGIVAVAGSTFDTIYGSLTVQQNGTWTYTSDAAVTSGTSVNHDKLTHDTEIVDTFDYSIIDNDGDVSGWASQAVTVTDTVPTVATPDSSSLSEASLPRGTSPNAPELTKAGTLAVTKGADGIDTKFDTTQTALNTLSLTSGGTALTYTVSNGGHTLTATAGSATIFTATITNPTANTAGYSVVLAGTIDHGGLTSIDLPIAYTVTDGDSDTAGKSFTVTIVDDRPLASQSFTTDEDTAHTINTNADATSTNTSVTTAAAHGTTSVNSDGTITYTPNADYSGSDTFTYQTVADDGSTVTTTVTVTVTPVADAPTVSAVANSIPTNEDTAVALGLKAPVINDTTDQNGAATAGDNPQLLRAGSLTGLPSGAQLLDASGTVLATSTGSAITVLISDIPHVSGATATLTMTAAQFEALRVLPPTESGSNFSVTYTVFSDEVDASGVKLATVNGASASTTVAVTVSAVTDPVSLSLVDGTDDEPLASDHTINEDTSFDLKDLLSVSYPNSDGNTTADVDGSETRWFEISGLPLGWTVNGTAVTALNPVIKVDASGLSTSATGLPAMVVKAPGDFSGDVNITVTLKAQDSDADNTVTTTVESSSVTLALHVDPVAGDVAATGSTTTEDTSVAFLAGVSVTDTSTSLTDGGIEVIDKVEFSLPTGWAVTAPAGAGFTAGLAAGTYTITFTDSALTEAQREAILDQFTIHPPAHSSKDETITLAITSTDTVKIGGIDTPVTATKDIDITVTVTPVAEVIAAGAAGDTDGNSAEDLTMAGSHTYSGSALEDTWFNLASDGGYSLSSGWSDEDSDEQVFAQLTPTLTGGATGDTIIGSQFQYTSGGSTVTVTYTGAPLNIPVSGLSTLQFMPPPNVTGTVQIGMTTYTVDTDPDTGATVTAVSGSATLTLPVFQPVADDVTLSLNARVVGLEDTASPLYIRPTSSDPSETFNVTIKNIPNGATITYNGVQLTVTGGSVTITNFDSSLPLTLTPPENSNDGFTLTVSAVSVDGISQSPEASLNINVGVKGVPDPVDVTLVDPAPTYSEAALDGGTAHIRLADLASTALTDGDGSEVATYQISGLPAGFSLSAGALLHAGPGADRIWMLTSAQLATAEIRAPANYSGTETITITPVTTENDGASTTWTAVSASFTVTPSPEAGITTSAVLVEDTISPLDLQIVHANADTDETLATVWIPVSAATSGTFDIYLGTAKLADAGLATVNVEGVMCYEIPAARIGDLGAMGAPNLDGDLGTFSFKYGILDNHFGAQPSGSTTSVFTGDFTLTATPVTDAIDARISAIAATVQGVGTATITDSNGADANASDTVTLTDRGTVSVDMGLINLIDTDGSEQVIRLLVRGVPEGVTVQDAEYAGGGTWIMIYAPGSHPIGPGGVVLPPLVFEVSAYADATHQQISIEVQGKDRPDDPDAGTTVATDTLNWWLTTDFVREGDGGGAALVNVWEYTGASANEDGAFTLLTMIDADVSVVDPGAPNTLTITLRDVPPDTIISGMYQTVIDGVTVWTASVVVPAGDDANAALDWLMNGIHITPPENTNDNPGNTPGGFHLNATLTTSTVSSLPQTSNITEQVPVIPTTDPATITIAATAVDEGHVSMPVTITVTNPADGDTTNAGIAGGLVYVKVDGTNGLGSGNLTDASGGPLGTTIIGGESYFVVTGVTPGTPVSLLYTPTNSTAGDVTFTVRTNSLEDGAPASVETIETATAPFNLVDNGVTIQTTPSSGNENRYIPVTGLNVALIDHDGSESVRAIMITDVPNGFQVFVGNDAASAVQASNAGGSGGTNSWVISNHDGSLPAYVAILPPAYWSGTLTNLNLAVESGENTPTSELLESFPLSDITVNAVSSGLTLAPSPTFGKESAVIPLNLNAAMFDPWPNNAPGAPDESRETTTLKLTGLGAYASFYLDGAQISSGVSYDAGTNTYTITGLTQSNLSDIGFMQAKSALTDMNAAVAGVQIKVEAFTVDGIAAPSISKFGEITVTSIAQAPTPGDDHLLWTGSPINAGGGTDTIELRNLEALSGAQLRANLSNIEVLDMNANHISTLSAADVLNMTSATSHVLRIDGGSTDILDIIGSDWTAGGTTTIGSEVYNVYTASIGGSAVELRVDQDIHLNTV